jgi:hypothetical protein
VGLLVAVAVAVLMADGASPSYWCSWKG